MLDTSYGVSCDVRSQHLFVYGSLCAPEVMAAVTGLRMRAVTARLANHRVLALRGEVYPGLTCAEGAGRGTAGRVDRDLPAGANGGVRAATRSRETAGTNAGAPRGVAMDHVGEGDEVPTP